MNIDTVAAPARPQGARRFMFLSLALLLVGAVLHLWYLIADCPIDVSFDETHYWEWARRLDFGYYCHPPMVAYIIAASRVLLADWSNSLVGSEALAVRLPAIVLSVITGMGIFFLARRSLDSAGMAFAAVAVTFTIPVFAVGAGIMTTDAPLACCWVWSLVFLLHALRANRMAAWIAAGICIGLGLLSKLTMLLIFPAFGLLLLSTPSLRIFLWRPGPYVATVIGFIGLSPVLYWNSQHEWITFLHMFQKAGVHDESSFDLTWPIDYVVGQFVVANPVWFACMVWAAIALLRRPPRVDEHLALGLRFLVFSALIPWLVFLILSPMTRIQANWPVIALLSATPLLVYWLNMHLRSTATAVRRRTRSAIICGVVTGAAMVIVAHYSHWFMPIYAWMARNAPPWELAPAAKYDPAGRLRGWKDIGRAVGEVLEDQKAAGLDPFILTSDLQLAGAIAFYCPSNPAVYCGGPGFEGRLSQYDIWVNPFNEPELFIGRPCIYVGGRRPELTGEDGRHAALPDMQLVRTVTHEVGGHPMRVVSIYTCDAFAGFEEARTLR